MARLARVVAPGIPHHVTQRGNRRQTTFFEESDYQLYLELALEWFKHHGARVWAYCLMPNHVHLIVVPEHEQSLSKAVGEVHQRYTRAINFRMGWRGHLWQGRFHSFPMDEEYLIAVARYVELNPVKAEMVETPQEYPWSSARHHLGLCEDVLLIDSPLRSFVDDWHGLLMSADQDQHKNLLRQSERSGRPVGSEAFLCQLECMLNRRLRKKKPGPTKRIK